MRVKVCEDFRLQYLFLWMLTTYWSFLDGVAVGGQCNSSERSCSWWPPGMSSGSIVPHPPAHSTKHAFQMWLCWKSTL